MTRVIYGGTLPQPLSQPAHRTRLLTGPALVGIAGLALVLAALWVVPGSPVTLWRADAAVGTASTATALALYDDVAEYGWTVSHRRLALQRGASLLATQLARPVQARQRLERSLTLMDSASARARMHEQIGLLWSVTRDHELAARSLVAAVEAAPASPHAPERLTLAARAATEAQRHDLAAALWSRLSEQYATHQSVAGLALGRLALSANEPERALRHFDDAVAFARSSDQRAAAKLGVATSLERLGNLDEAIAELDSVDLPGGVRGSRLDSLRLRRGERGH